MNILFYMYNLILYYYDIKKKWRGDSVSLSLMKMNKDIFGFIDNNEENKKKSMAKIKPLSKITEIVTRCVRDMVNKKPLKKLAL